MKPGSFDPAKVKYFTSSCGSRFNNKQPGVSLYSRIVQQKPDEYKETSDKQRKDLLPVVGK